MDNMEKCLKLLKVARCPECDGCGYTVREVGGCDEDGENDTRECVQEECQWCDERAELLRQYKNFDDAARIIHDELGAKYTRMEVTTCQ